jgi:hypothetical protein
MDLSIHREQKLSFRVFDYQPCNEFKVRHAADLFTSLGQDATATSSSSRVRRSPNPLCPFGKSPLCGCQRLFQAGNAE